MKIHAFMHVNYEGLGHIEDWIKEHGFDLSITQWHKKEHPPALQDIDALIVLGGPMGVYDTDKHPWLLEEKAYIRSALEHRVPILGVCLGAQILSEQLGGEVTVKEHAEIGWHSIDLNPEFQEHAISAAFEGPHPTVFQWHNDGFSLPPGAISIGSSPANECQGFIFAERWIGLQFHLEMNAHYITRLLNKARHDLKPGKPYIMSEAMIKAHFGLCEAMKAAMYKILDSWIQRTDSKQR